MNAREPDVIFDPGYADYSLLGVSPAPYLPRNNEVMGSDTTTEPVERFNQYRYNPISYKTPSASYFDSWNPIKERFTPIDSPQARPFNYATENFMDFRFNTDFLLIVFLFIIVVVLSYFQQKQIDNLNQTIIGLKQHP